MKTKELKKNDSSFYSASRPPKAPKRCNWCAGRGEYIVWYPRAQWVSCDKCNGEGVL